MSEQEVSQIGTDANNNEEKRLVELVAAKLENVDGEVKQEQQQQGGAATFPAATEEMQRPGEPPSASSATSTPRFSSVSPALSSYLPSLVTDMMMMTEGGGAAASDGWSLRVECDDVLGLVNTPHKIVYSLPPSETVAKGDFIGMYEKDATNLKNYLSYQFAKQGSNNGFVLISTPKKPGIFDFRYVRKSYQCTVHSPPLLVRTSASVLLEDLKKRRDSNVSAVRLLEQILLEIKSEDTELHRVVLDRWKTIQKQQARQSMSILSSNENNLSSSSAPIFSSMVESNESASSIPENSNPNSDETARERENSLPQTPSLPPLPTPPPPPQKFIVLKIRGTGYYAGGGGAAAAGGGIEISSTTNTTTSTTTTTNSSLSSLSSSSFSGGDTRKILLGSHEILRGNSPAKSQAGLHVTVLDMRHLSVIFSTSYDTQNDSGAAERMATDLAGMIETYSLSTPPLVIITSQYLWEGKFSSLHLCEILGSFGANLEGLFKIQRQTRNWVTSSSCAPFVLVSVPGVFSCELIGIDDPRESHTAELELALVQVDDEPPQQLDTSYIPYNGEETNNEDQQTTNNDSSNNNNNNEQNDENNIETNNNEFPSSSSSSQHWEIAAAKEWLGSGGGGQWSWIFPRIPQNESKTVKRIMLVLQSLMDCDHLETLDVKRGAFAIINDLAIRLLGEGNDANLGHFRVITQAAATLAAASDKSRLLLQEECLPCLIRFSSCHDEITRNFAVSAVILIIHDARCSLLPNVLHLAEVCENKEIVASVANRLSHINSHGSETEITTLFEGGGMKTIVQLASLDDNREASEAGLLSICTLAASCDTNRKIEMIRCGCLAVLSRRFCLISSPPQTHVQSPLGEGETSDQRKKIYFEERKKIAAAFGDLLATPSVKTINMTFFDREMTGLVIDSSKKVSLPPNQEIPLFYSPKISPPLDSAIAAPPPPPPPPSAVAAAAAAVAAVAVSANEEVKNNNNGNIPSSSEGVSETINSETPVSSTSSIPTAAASAAVAVSSSIVYGGGCVVFDEKPIKDVFQVVRAAERFGIAALVMGGDVDFREKTQNLLSCFRELSVRVIILSPLDIAFVRSKMSGSDLKCRFSALQCWTQFVRRTCATHVIDLFREMTSVIPRRDTVESEGNNNGGDNNENNNNSNIAIVKTRSVERQEAERVKILTTLTLLGLARRPLRGRGGIRVLAMDGGGTRGLVILEMLKEIERRTNRRIFDLFDVVVGTSTGGLLAVATCLLKKSLNECSDWYKSLSGDVFSQAWFSTAKQVWTCAKYDTHKFEAKLTQQIGTAHFVDQTTLQEMLQSKKNDIDKRENSSEEGEREKKQQEDKRKNNDNNDDLFEFWNTPHVALVSTLVSVSPAKPFVWRNYVLDPCHESRYLGTHDAMIWTGVRATSAAPSYFDELVHNQLRHYDGGLTANNPAAIALYEAQKLYPHSPLRCLVSLGSGVPPPSLSSSGGGWQGIASCLVDSVCDVNRTDELLSDLLGGEEEEEEEEGEEKERKYFRFNPQGPLFGVELDQTNIFKLEAMQAATARYVEEEKETFDKLAAVLLD